MTQRILRLWRELPNQRPITFITFNYDLALDYALSHDLASFGGPNYCLPALQQSSPVPLLKLHGSINWGYLQVPPTWNKTDYHGELAHVWSRASEELASAENIFVLGYSLPESDSFFRYLYALGSESSNRIKRFWVFNPDSDGSVQARFRAMIGRGIEKRFQFIDGESGTFASAIPQIYEELRKV